MGQLPTIGEWTVEGWVQPAASNGTGLLILQADDYTGWSMELDDGQLTLWLSTNQGWQYDLHPTGLEGGQWYHVAATYGGGQVRTYVNGISSGGTSVGVLVPGPELRLGGFSGYAHFAGAMDEVRVSDVVRYTGDFEVPTGPYVVDGNTIGLWHFDEGAGQLVNDISGNSNNGTLGSNNGSDNADPTWVEGAPFATFSTLSSSLAIPATGRFQLYLPIVIKN
jgi:hypothetical protein